MNDHPSFSSLTTRLGYGAGLDPARDWIVLLIASAAVLVAVIAWNIWVFEHVAQGGGIGTDMAAEPAAFSRTSLDTIRAVFANRAAEEAKYASGAYTFTDPSQ
jgi:hypothetical protein